jgi:hypothetical protein
MRHLPTESPAPTSDDVRCQQLSERYASLSQTQSAIEARTVHIDELNNATSRRVRGGPGIDN